MPSLSTEKLNSKLKNPSSITTAVKTKINALENILDYIKSNGTCEPKTLIKSKQKAVKLFGKMLKIIKNIENGKYDNINAICDKKLPKLLRDLKTKSLFYHLEAVFVENLQNSMFKEINSFSKHSTRTNLNQSSDNLSSDLINRNVSLNKSVSESKQENIFNNKPDLLFEIDKYVKHFLINISIIKIQKHLVDEIIDGFVQNSEQNYNEKFETLNVQIKETKQISTINGNGITEMKEYLELVDIELFNRNSSSNNNSSEIIRKVTPGKFKTFTTFLYYNNNHCIKKDFKLSKFSSLLSINDNNTKKRNIYLKIKDLKEKCGSKINLIAKSTNHFLFNKEIMENNKTIDEVSSRAMKFEFSSNDMVCDVLNEDRRLEEERLDLMNDRTHSISGIHVLKDNQAVDQTISSNCSISQSPMKDSVFDSSIEITKNNNQAVRTVIKYELPCDIKCTRIINAAIQSAKLTCSRANVSLKFVLSTEEKVISVKNLESIKSYETKLCLEGDRYSHYTVGINLSTFLNLNQGIQHECKIKRFRIIKQIVLVPKIVLNYLNDINSKKDHRILRIEQFCNCQISLKNKFDFNENLNCNYKSNILISIIYDIEKGNEIGCLNMIKRMLNIFQYQVRIIREYKLTVEGLFEEAFYK